MGWFIPRARIGLHFAGAVCKFVNLFLNHPSQNSSLIVAFTLLRYRFSNGKKIFFSISLGVIVNSSTFEL